MSERAVVNYHIQRCPEAIEKISNTLKEKGMQVK
jgi:hypothetical protein